MDNEEGKEHKNPERNKVRKHKRTEGEVKRVARWFKNKRKRKD